MTDMILDCAGFNDRLLAHMEREDDDATRAAMERHAAGCSDCGALLAELKELRMEASRLPELQPSRDLWAGIAERIEAPVVPIGVHAVAVNRSVRVRRWTTRTLIAASLLGAAGLGYAVRGTPEPVVIAQTPIVLDSAADAPIVDSAPVATVARAPRTTNSVVAPAPASVPAPQPPLAVQLAAREVASLAADYDREIARLQLLVNQRRNQLDPATVAVIEKNLLVIDTAIAECKKAIARDPASEFLIEALNQSLRTKVELMRTAALLPSRT